MNTSPDSTPATHARFEIVDDEQVLDHQTGLIWTRGNVPGGSMAWKAAQEACSKLEIGGASDWRLPTISELLSLVDYERHGPAIDADVFRCESTWYWTGTPYAPSPGDCAWGVYFDNGGAYWDGHGGDGFVRAVRAGQS